MWARRDRLFPGGLIRRRPLPRRVVVQALVLDQTLADIKKANRFVLERRPGGIIAEGDMRSLIDRIHHAESPGYVAPV